MDCRLRNELLLLGLHCPRRWKLWARGCGCQPPSYYAISNKGVWIPAFIGLSLRQRKFNLKIGPDKLSKPVDLRKTCRLRRVSLHHRLWITNSSNIRIFHEMSFDSTRRIRRDMRFDESNIRIFGFDRIKIDITVWKGCIVYDVAGVCLYI